MFQAWEGYNHKNIVCETTQYWEEWSLTVFIYMFSLQWIANKYTGTTLW